jgi:hypothetical protein
MDLNLTIESFDDNEIIIREGEAPPHIDPVKLTANGDIKTVSTFIKGRLTINGLQGVHAYATIVTVNKEAGTIQIETDPNDKFASVLSGKLEMSDELKLFGINKERKFTQKQLIKLLKFNRIYFKDPLTHQDLLKQYTAFVFQTSTQGHANLDDRGNKSAAIAKTVDTNIPKEFTLKIPIYKGEREMEFRVEICIEVTDGGAEFWLESIELHELEQIEKEFIFKRELEACEGLVVIFK